MACSTCSKHLLRQIGRFFSSSSCSSGSLFNTHRSVLPLASLTPYTASPSYIAPSAAVCGEVDIENSACVFENAAIRGDAGTVRIKANACIGQVCVSQRLLSLSLSLSVCVCVNTVRDVCLFCWDGCMYVCEPRARKRAL